MTQPRFSSSSGARGPPSGKSKLAWRLDCLPPNEGLRRIRSLHNGRFRTKIILCNFAENRPSENVSCGVTFPARFWIFLAIRPFSVTTYSTIFALKAISAPISPPAFPGLRLRTLGNKRIGTQFYVKFAISKTPRAVSLFNHDFESYRSFD